MTSTIRPMFSSATLRTSLPRTACTVRGSKTAADGGSELPAPGLSLGVSKVGAVLCALRLSADTRKGELDSASRIAATATDMGDGSRICPSKAATVATPSMLSPPSEFRKERRLPQTRLGALSRCNCSAPAVVQAPRSGLTAACPSEWIRRRAHASYSPAWTPAGAGADRSRPGFNNSRLAARLAKAQNHLL